MKKSVIIPILTAATLLLGGCKFEYPLPDILSDPTFEESGFQRYITVSIYEQSPLSLTIQRNAGLSKELTVDIVVDQAVLDEYNRVNETSHKMLPAKYYSLSPTATFEARSKEAEITGTIYAEQIVKDLGLESGSNMIIPLRIQAQEAEIEGKASMAEALVSVQIVDPKLDVDSKGFTLSFIPISPLKQTVQLKATANFNTLETGKVTYTVDPSKVASYAGEHGIDVSLLPEDRYVIGTPVFDSETMTLTTDVTLDCASIGGNGKYLLPLMLTQTAGYEVVQKSPVYILVEMSQLIISISGSGTPVTSATGQGEIELQINTALPDDQAIALKYAPERVSGYNAAHGTSYQSMDAAKVTLGTESAIKAGEKSGKVSFLVNLAEVKYDTGAPYLLPFVIDGTPLLDGTVYNADETFWLVVNKSRAGDFIITELKEGAFTAGPHKAATLSFNNTWRKMVGKIWLWPDMQATLNPSSHPMHDQVYGVVYSDRWSDGILYFDVDENPMEGQPTRYALVNMQDRSTTGNAEWNNSMDEITYNCSYFDEADGSFYFDFVIDNGSTAYEMGFIYTRP